MTTQNDLELETAPRPTGSGSTPTRLSPWRRLASQYGSELALAVIIIVVGAVITIGNPVFLTPSNLVNVLLAVSVTGIAAIGATLVIVSGHLDLSVGSNLGYSGLVGALVMQFGIPALGIPAGILVGALVGLANGLLVTYGRVNSFITTLGMLSVVRGLALITTGGSPVDVPASLQVIGQGSVVGIPVPVLILLILVIVAQLFLSRTVLGRRITAVGDNDRAAFLAGVPVRGTIIAAFVLAGVFAAIAGLVNATNLALAPTDAGTGAELDVIAAVIVGGTSLTGGRGSIIGTLLGSCLLGMLRNAFVLLQLSPYLQVTTIGAVIVLAALVDQIRLRRS